MRSYVLSIVTPLNSSPNTSQIHNHLPTAPSLYHLNSWIIHWAQIVVPIWFWAWYWLSTGVCTTLKHNWIILHQKQSTAVTSVLPFYLLAGVLIGLVLCRHCANSPNHCELMSVSPCHVLETLFHFCPLRTLEFLKSFLSRGGVTQIYCLWLSSLLTVSILWTVVSLYINHHTLPTGTSLMRSVTACIYRRRDTGS